LLARGTRRSGDLRDAMEGEKKETLNQKIKNAREERKDEKKVWENEEAQLWRRTSRKVRGQKVGKPQKIDRGQAVTRAAGPVVWSA